MSILCVGLLLCSWFPTVFLQNLSFTIEPKSVIVRRGNPTIFNCQTNIQTSHIIIQWKKGYEGLWIVNYKNKPYQLLGNNSLYFPTVGPGDEDVYFCTAFKQGSPASAIESKKPAHITLAYINSNFTTHPYSVTKREHETATLTCVSGASQPLASVTWEKNGQPITDQGRMGQNHLLDRNATSATLEIKDLSILGDAAFYRCVAINPLFPNEPKRSQEAFLTVLPKDGKPRIEIPPLNTVSPERQPLRLDCFIVGDPTPTVYWFHNDILVVNSTGKMVYPNGSLFFPSLSRGDNGQYSCHGNNSKGSVTSNKIFLRVAYIEFKFKKNPENRAFVNGTRAEMICEAPDHFPNSLEYKWYKNYKGISLDERVKKSSSGSLLFLPVIKSDEDVYFCSVSLPKTYGMIPRTSSTAQLTVNVPPYFLTKPSDQIVTLGDNLSLMCRADGFPSPRLKWYHRNKLLGNTSRLTIGANGSLVLKRIDRDDAGTYECRAENIAGKNVARASVVVHVPPNVTIVPRDKSVIWGNSVTFWCQFAGNPPPVTIWYFKRANQRAVRLSRNSSRYIQKDNEKLIVVNVTEYDNGVFTCVGENVVGMQNFSASLTILVPARFSIFPRNTTVNESDVAEITCGGYGNPEPEVTWSRSEKVLSNSNRISIIDGKLRIRNVTRKDEGLYSCTVENYLQSKNISVYLTVQVSPSISVVRSPSRVQRRQNVSFVCKSDGVPSPRIIWLKDNREVPYTTRIYAQKDELHIISSGNNDTGNYTCQASNLLGSTEMTRQLIVEVPPSEPWNVKFGTITSTSLQIIWLPGFNGYSPITSYKIEIGTNSSRVWTKVSQHITSLNYTVIGLKPFTVYQVRVFAENKIGWSKPSEIAWNRTAEDAPSKPRTLLCETVNSSTVLLNWDEPSEPNGKVRRYEIQFGNQSNNVLKSLSTSSMMYHVTGLYPYTWYRFRVRGATGLEATPLWGNYSSYVRCRSGEAAPMAAPKNLTLTSTGPYSILVEWQEIPIGTANGIVKAYWLQFKTGDINCTDKHIAGNATLQYNITGLEPWTVYEVRIAAITIARGPWTSPRELRTMESVPSGPPSNVTVTAMSSNSLSITWDPPLVESQNGEIRGYMVVYGVVDSIEERWNLTTNETNSTLNGLKIYTSYWVKIRAFTHVGFGPYSDEVLTRTLESYPSFVTNLMYNITGSSVVVTWQPPHSPNGIITAYTTYLNTTTVRIFRRPGTNITVYNVTSQSREITTRVTRVVLNGSYGNVTYTLCVAARTSVGYGPCSEEIVFKTNFTKKLRFEDEGPTSSIIEDHWPLIAGGAAILFVLLIAIFVCCCIRRRKRKKGEKESKQAFNFQRRSYPMRSLDDDGESSYVSRGSRPINGYSIESSSVHSQTNPINEYATPEDHDGSPLVRLRNSSLALGSDASSYDAPYSSVDEIGVDPTTVHSVYAPPHSTDDHTRHFVNALYTEREQEDNRGETGSLDSHVEVNPIYEPSYPQMNHSETVNSLYETWPGDEEDYPEGEGPVDYNNYAVLILPPPPPEYSDFGDDTEDFSHAVTDF